MKDAYYCGVDIGGTKCSVVLGEATLDAVRILEKERFATDIAAGPEAVIARIEGTIRQLLSRGSLRDEPRAIGVSCGGPLDSIHGTILSPPNLPGWDRVPIVSRLRQTFDRPVALQNDANACALAEFRYGAGRGCRNMVFLTFGTGLGAGLILGGRLYRGTNDMAGEIGHIRLDRNGPVGYGKAGSFEGFCSGGGIAQLAASMVREKLQQGEKVSFCGSPTELSSLTALQVARAAEAGDPLAREIYAACGEWLGRGLAVVIDILNPERIVLGNIFAKSRDLLWPAARREIEREALRASAGVCQVLPAALGGSLGDVSALCVAMEAGANMETAQPV